MDRFRLILPLLRRLAPETAHDLSLLALRCGLGPGAGAPDDPVLATRLWGRAFSNPVGLAAGFDKNAVAARRLLGLGFGFVEVGTVTPRPQAGNPRPRVFRLPADRAAINRIGFANVGQAVAARRLSDLRRRAVPGPVGVNLGKNKETVDAAADYAAGARALAPTADYLVINVSSPNTPGLRALQGRRELEAIVARVRDALGAAMAGADAPPPPLLVKIAPDLAP
ncbi:MAG: dihydroorotate dehydrogenase (quinone), partial [Kiloniellaceae bacterium]